ncbi:Secreted phosphoprotein 24 [Channa argus]|uniref:Secreted phosphoprotein 24 n=1 Tax=Channa argus TaxID=215402 RepID=A0A6G1QUZ4_CHAAH|nr:Secreted phosphoprotein 24 [Channa argus]
MKNQVTLVLVKMKLYILLWSLLQFLGCSGNPLYNPGLRSVANRGLEAALAEVNSVYAVSNLYKVTQASVKKVVPLTMNTADLLLVFTIKETECAKASMSELQTCAFRPGFFVPSFWCSSRVRISATSTQVVTLSCGHDGSSSSESSEELFSRGRHHLVIQFGHRDPDPSEPTPPPPVKPGRLIHSQTPEVQPRGDTFSNFLV